MARDERASSAGSASGMFAREGGGFDAVDGGESIHFGCSMLSRIRLRPRNGARLATMRCHLGYALHSDEEVAKCLAVEGPGECWKVVPTWRVPVAAPVPVEPAAALVELDEPAEAAEVVVLEQVVETRVVPFRQPQRPTGTDDSEAD